MRLSRSSIGYNSKCLTFLLVTLYTIGRHLFVSFGSSLSFALVQQQECVPYFTIELFTYETQRRNQRNTLLQKNHIDFGFRCFFCDSKTFKILHNRTDFDWYCLHDEMLDVIKSVNCKCAVFLVATAQKPDRMHYQTTMKRFNFALFFMENEMIWHFINNLKPICR